MHRDGSVAVVSPFVFWMCAYVISRIHAVVATPSHFHFGIRIMRHARVVSGQRLVSAVDHPVARIGMYAGHHVK